MKIKRIVVGDFFTNCYIIWCEETGKGAIIDPGDESEKIKHQIEKEKIKVEIIINTHGHFDHIGENEKFSLPVYIHKLDEEYLKNPEKNLSILFGTPFICNCQTKILQESDIIKIGNISLNVLHTPGHTPGSISLLGENFVFTGDTIFAGGIGRTDLVGGDEEELLNSIKKLLKLPEKTIIYPGHGEISTLSEEISFLTSLF